MRVLLDTHIFLWWQDNPLILSKAASAIIEDPKNTIFISAAVSWELIIKSLSGKLTLPMGVIESIEEEPFIPLPISVNHTITLNSLENHHKDPFDRIMLAQAKNENLIFITRDSQCLKYKEVKLVKG